MSDIGVLNEKPLHASLKAWYAEPGDRFEVPVDGYVIDIVRGDLLLEIQTRNLSAMKAKLSALTPVHQVRVIHPIAQTKWITKLAAKDGAESTRRKSPKRGRIEDLFREAVSLPALLADPNFALEVVMIEEEEVLRRDGKRHWRRRGWTTEERRLLGVVDRWRFETPFDWRVLLPDDLVSFTTSDLADALGIRRELAQQMAYCLRQVSVIELIGKSGRSNLFRVADG